MIPSNIKYEENNAFISFDNNVAGLIFDDSKHSKYPIRYYNIINGNGNDFKSKADCSYYGYVYGGNLKITQSHYPTQNLIDGQYFSVTGEFEINSYESSKLIVIEVLHTKGIYPENNYRAMPSFGGPIEEVGRLKYIDGCTDSLLISPVKKGDPCFNHLHFPKDIVQTQHTHPSHRIGIVADGHGVCVTPFGNLPLVKGMIFVIKEWTEEMVAKGNAFAKGLDGETHACGMHAFNTPVETGMDVIAFHPDSDFGSTDEVHPMINRTIVRQDGKLVSAGSVEDIRTK
jgi:hypothetical protein